jgi:hypothetical protein
MYKLSEYPITKELFRQYFANSIGKFYEKELSASFAQVHINIIAFDEWLQTKHGNYEQRGFSLKTIVIKEYGLPALEFLNQIS